MAASALMGAFAAVVQVIVPMAASLSPAADRGRAVGIVFSGSARRRARRSLGRRHLRWLHRLAHLVQGGSCSIGLMAVLLWLRLPAAPQPRRVRLTYPELTNFKYC
jgi:hypothetical protein